MSDTHFKVMKSPVEHPKEEIKFLPKYTSS